MRLLAQPTEARREEREPGFNAEEAKMKEDQRGTDSHWEVPAGNLGGAEGGMKERRPHGFIYS